MTVGTGIKSFFDSVLLIDDEVTLDVEANLENQIDTAPARLVKALQRHGIVVCPFPLKNRARLDEAITLSLNAKLTILDWDLENGFAKPIPGGRKPNPVLAPDVVRGVLEKRHSTGMQWIVVYTREELEGLPTDLLSYVRGHWNTDKPELLKSFGDAVANCTSGAGYIALDGLFITFMNKADVEPQALFDQFEATLNTAFGAAAVNLLGMAGEMERHSFRVMQEFTKPFDLSLNLHTATSELTTVGSAEFLFRLYADNVVGTADVSLYAEALAAAKKDALLRLRDLFAENDAGLAELLARLRLPPNPLGIGDWQWSEVLSALISAKSDEYNLVLTPERLKSFKIEGKPKSIARKFRSALEILMSYAGWRLRYPSGGVTDYFSHMNAQSNRFARLLKYEIAAPALPVKTGNIYYDSHSRQYLLCITPFCDTARPSKVGNRFKFVVGRETLATNDRLEVLSENSHASFIPALDSEGLSYVTWSFFETVVLEPSGFYLSEWVAGGRGRSYLVQNLGHIEPALCNLEDDLRQTILDAMIDSGLAPEDRDRLTEQLGLFRADAAVSAEDPRKWFEAPNYEEKLAPLRRYRFVSRMKKEYVQQIINKYVAYHSRAGVPELYFKEWPAELFSVLHEMPQLMADLDQVKKQFGLGKDSDAWLLASHTGFTDWYRDVLAQVGSERSQLLIDLTRDLQEIMRHRQLIEIPVTTAAVAEFIEFEASGKVRANQAKNLLAKMVATGRTASDLLSDEGHS